MGGKSRQYPALLEHSGSRRSEGTRDGEAQEEGV